MSRFLTLKQGDSVVLVEVTSEGATRPLGQLQDAVSKIDRTLDDVLGKSIEAHCAALAGTFDRLRAHRHPPNGATVEFGLQVNGEGDFYVVRAAVQATYKVSLNWAFKKTDEPTS